MREVSNPLYNQDIPKREIGHQRAQVCVDFRLGNPPVDILPKQFML